MAVAAERGRRGRRGGVRRWLSLAVLVVWNRTLIRAGSADLPAW